MTTVQSAVRWKLLEQMASQGLAFLGAVLLARLLLPADFGLFAMMYLPLALADLFAKGGLAQALIQRQDVTTADESTVFWFNLGVSAGLALVLFLLAPTIAAFFEQPRLVTLMRVLVLDLLLSALATVPITRLMKSLDFRRLALVSAVSIGGSGLLAVLLALAGWGVWALVMQLLLAGVIRLIVLFLLEDWRPQRVFESARFRRLFGYGVYLMMASVATLIARQAYTVFVGKLYAPADLGVFNRAMNTRGMPQTFIRSMYQEISFPVLSKLVDDRAQLRESLRASLVSVMALALPVMAGLALVAEDFVPALFGPNWNAVVPYLQILCIGAAAWSLNMVNMNALQALGEARLLFRLQFGVQLLLLLVVAATAPSSLLALAIGIASVEYAAVLISTGLLRRRIGYGLGRQLHDLAPYLGLLAVMVVAVLAQRTFFPADRPVFGLLTSTAVGAAVYLLPMFVLRMEAAGQILALLGRSPGSAER